MPDQLPLRIRLVVATAGAVLLIGLSFVFLQYGLGYFKGGFQLHARFTSSVQGLSTTSDVKIRGVTVGSVTGIHLGDGGVVDVIMKLHPGTKVAATTVASIEPLSVFGPGYVNLEPGADEVHGPFLRDGDRVPHTKTSAAFTALVSHAGTVLDEIDIDDLQTVIHTVAQGITGLGPTFGDLLDNTSKLTDIVSAHADQIPGFLADLNALTQTLEQHVGSLQTTTGALNSVLPALNARGDQLTSVLDQASSLSGQLATYLDQHRAGITQLFDDGSGVLKIAYDQSSKFPSILDVLNQFFDRVGSAARLPGPGGVLSGAVFGDFFTSVCANAKVPVACTPVVP